MSLSVSHGSPVTLVQILNPDGTESGFGITHPAYLTDLRTGAACPPFAMYRVFPGSDYYEGSVTIGFSPLRPSRVTVAQDVRARL